MRLSKRVGYGVAACGLGLIVGLPIALRQMSAAPASASEPTPAPVSANETRAVRVEHEFIPLADAVPAQSVAPVRAPALRAVHTARPLRTEPKTLAAKTRRALLGDGRHRPEPFPRAR